MKKNPPPLIPRPIFVKPHIRIQKSRYNPSMTGFLTLPEFIRKQVDEDFTKKSPNLPRVKWTLCRSRKERKRNDL